MTHAEIITLGPEGHVAIPPELRKGFKEGQTLVAIRDEDRLILEKVSTTNEQLKEDLEFARRTEEAWKEYEKGNFKRYSVDEFLTKLQQW